MIRKYPSQINRLTAYRQLGTNLRLRYAPEIVWSLDDSITYGAKMLGLINSLGVKHDEDSVEE